MSDLIDRQQAIDAARDWYEGLICGSFKGLEKRLRALPPAEPEIIRCKDCKHWDTTWQNDYSPNYHYCPMIDGTHRNDFYCADAERRTDG